ncbi:MAG: threonine/serine exporter family protein [Lachnospiraceae bacterium]|nr:threonine/serine exporter family protein [Lachnospiraceae bacterium]
MDDNRDLDVVIDAGKTLMESGAEISRVEETMRHMAKVMEITEFDAYTVTGGIMSTGINKEGERVSRVANVPEIRTHLRKLEAVNDLSRKLEKEGNPGAEEIERRLAEIRKMPNVGFVITVLAYFFASGGFAYATGSTVIDSLASAVTGLILGILTYFIEKVIKTKFLVTIIGSVTVTLLANLFCYLGFGHMRGLIILGTFMVMVPGAVFVNSVREFSENNYATGISHLMSALLTSISMAVGVAAVSEVLPFSEQMAESFATSVESVPEMIFRVVMAGVGTIAFSFLYHAPKKYFPDLFILGAVSWLIYLLISGFLQMENLAILAAAGFVAVGSMILSVKRKCPMTVFLSTSIFPLIPGITLYRGIYFLLTGQHGAAYSFMKSSFMCAFMIAIAISFAKQLQSIYTARGKLFKPAHRDCK